MARKPADQAVHRPEILLAAANVFRKKGYHGAKMADIAAEVNLTAGSLYHHFPGGKQQLLRDVLVDGLERIIADLHAIANNHDLAPPEKLRRAIHAHVVELTENVSVAAALVFETRTLLQDADARDEYLALRDTFEGLYRQVVQEGIDQQVFRPVDVPIFTKTLLGAHNWVGVWYRREGRLSGQEIADEMATIFLQALL